MNEPIISEQDKISFKSENIVSVEQSKMASKYEESRTKKVNLDESDNVSNINKRTSDETLDVLNESDIMEDDFVLLGENLTALKLQASSSYIDIQEKSMSVYQAMLPSFNAAGLNPKLHKLLYEKVKLTETLKQNNIAMQQQFHIMTICKEIIMDIHKNHEQKCTEMKKLIDQLEKENAELKTKFNSKESDVTEPEFEIINTISQFTDDINQMKLHNKMAMVIEELHNSKLDRAKLLTDVDKYKNMIETMKMQLQSATRIIDEQSSKITKLELESAFDESPVSISDTQDELLPKVDISKNINNEDLNSTQELITEERKELLKIQTKSLLQEKEEFEEKKKIVAKHMLNIDKEYSILQQQKTSLKKERKALETNIKLFKKVNNVKEYVRLQLDNDSMMKHIVEQQVQIRTLKSELIKNNGEDDIVQKLKQQLHNYEKKLQKQEELKELLLKENDRIVSELQKQVFINNRLQQRLDAKSSSQSVFRMVGTKNDSVEDIIAACGKCGKCGKTFTSKFALAKHDKCLQST